MNETTANAIIEDAHVSIMARARSYRGICEAENQAALTDDEKESLGKISQREWRCYYEDVNQVIAAAEYLGMLKACKSIAATVRDCECNRVKSEIARLTGDCQVSDK